MPSFAGARELRGLLGLGRNVVQGAGAFLGPQLFMQGRPGTALDKGVQNLPGIIPDPRNDAGRNLGRSLVNELRYMGGQLGRGSLPYLGNEMRYAAGQLSQGTIPYTNASFGGTKPSGGQRNYGPGYKEKELAAGQAAESFRSGAGFPGQQTAADRAYEAEKSRVAQLTAQDPELQRYEAARKIAAAPGATPEQVQSAEDIGMQIWAQKYGKTLAPKVKPGQAGYDVIQKTLYPGGTPAPTLSAESEAMLNAIAPANEFGVRPDVTPMPGQLPSFGSATEAMFDAVTAGGSLVTPMPQTAPTPQTQAQDLAEAYRQAMLARLVTNK